MQNNMKKLLWKSFALSSVWQFMFEHDAHHIVSERGLEVLNQNKKIKE
jgi:hypothetical protein